MKDKKLVLFLTLEAGVLILLRALTDFKVEGGFDLLSYPLQKLADFLGFLSLESAFGNAVAIVIYITLCLVPILALLVKVKRKTFTKTDSLLVLMSAVLFGVVYLLINPSEMGFHGTYEGTSSMVAFSFWCVFFGYLLLKFTEKISSAEGDRVQELLSLVLKIMGAVFVFALCSMKLTKTEVGIMTLLGVLNTAVPYVLGIVIVFLSLSLLREFTSDRYSESTLSGAEKLSSFCIISLEISVVVSIIFNVLQLRFISALSNINFSFNVPLFSLGFILLVLIFTAFIKDSKALKEDNDSFI